MQSIDETILRQVVVILGKQPPEEELEAFRRMLEEEKINSVWYVAGMEAAERSEADVPEEDLEKNLQILDGRAENAAEDKKKKGILFLSDNAGICRLALEGGCSCVAYLTEEDGEKGDFSAVRYAVLNLANLDRRYLERVCRRCAGLPWEILRTERCLVREMTTADVPFFYEIYKEASITAYMEGLFPEPEQEIEYVRSYIKNVYEFYEYGLWTIVDMSSGQIIGRAGLSWREETETAELGYVIAVPFQRKGYAFEVCSAVLRYAWEELEMEEVAAYICSENTASIGLCKKLGFQYEGDILIQNKSYGNWRQKNPYIA